MPACDVELSIRNLLAPISVFIRVPFARLIDAKRGPDGGNAGGDDCAGDRQPVHRVSPACPRRAYGGPLYAVSWFTTSETVGGLPGVEGLKVFGGCVSVEGLVGSESVELAGEGVDPSVDVIEVVVGQVPCGVELVSPCAVVALDVCVEFGGSGREFEEVDAAFLAFVFEVGFELGSGLISRR